MKTIFNLFGRRFKQWYHPDAVMKERIELLARSNPRQISCKDVSLVLDGFTKAIHRGENVLLFMPLIRQHLDVCPACRDQYERILNALQPKAN